MSNTDTTDVHAIGGIADFIRTKLDGQNSVERAIEVAPGHILVTMFDGALLDVKVTPAEMTWCQSCYGWHHPAAYGALDRAAASGETPTEDATNAD